jgi:pilus assembly protein CpaB
VVNLLVTPEQAEIVSLASNSATIQMVLRNPLDKEDSKTNGVFLGKLFGANPGAALPVEPSAAARAPRRPAPQPAAPVAAAKPAPPPPPVIVEILHGSAKAQVTFKQEETKSK